VEEVPPDAAVDVDAAPSATTTKNGNNTIQKWKSH